MNAGTDDFKVGDTVKLRRDVRRILVPEGRENNQTAKIVAFLDNTPGGVFLDRDLNGIRYWNTSDLDHAH